MNIKQPLHVLTIRLYQSLHHRPRTDLRLVGPFGVIFAGTRVTIGGGGADSQGRIRTEAKPKSSKKLMNAFCVDAARALAPA